MAFRTESYGASDIGLRRLINQDSLFFEDAAGLYVVADGMGGHSAGEVASGLAVKTVRDFVARSRLADAVEWPCPVDAGLSYNGNCLRAAIILANRRIWQEAGQRPDLAGMGTTIVAALAEEDVITLASAGDSRAYCIRQRAIRQLTVDDSWVQAALERGVLSSEQIRNHAMRNVITKAVGANEEIEPRVLEERLQPGDYYLFCSDGLHGTISDSDILEIILSSGGDLRRSVTALIDAANAGGGKDNITVLLLACHPASA